MGKFLTLDETTHRGQVRQRSSGWPMRLTGGSPQSTEKATESGTKTGGEAEAGGAFRPRELGAAGVLGGGVAAVQQDRFHVCHRGIESRTFSARFRHLFSRQGPHLRCSNERRGR